MKTLHTAIFIIIGIAVFAAFSLDNNPNLASQEDAKALRKTKAEFLTNLECKPNNNAFKFFDKTKYFDHKEYHRKLASSCLDNINSDETIEQYLLHHMLSGGKFISATKTDIVSQYISKRPRRVLQHDNIYALRESATTRALKYHNSASSTVIKNVNSSRRDLDSALNFLQKNPKGYEEIRIWFLLVFFCLFLMLVIPTLVLRPFIWFRKSISKKSRD